MKVEGVDNEITGNSLRARSRGKRIERAVFLCLHFEGTYVVTVDGIGFSFGECPAFLCSFEGRGCEFVFLQEHDKKKGQKSQESLY